MLQKVLVGPLTKWMAKVQSLLEAFAEDNKDIFKIPFEIRDNSGVDVLLIGSTIFDLLHGSTPGSINFLLEDWVLDRDEEVIKKKLEDLGARNITYFPATKKKINFKIRKKDVSITLSSSFFNKNSPFSVEEIAYEIESGEFYSMGPVWEESMLSGFIYPSLPMTAEDVPRLEELLRMGFKTSFYFDLLNEEILDKHKPSPWGTDNESASSAIEDLSSAAWGPPPCIEEC